MTGPAAEQNAKDLRFIQSISSRSRSLTDPERDEVATVAATKPNTEIEINFDYNSDTLNQRAIPMVTQLGQALTDPELKGGVFLVGGYTDAKGGDEFNLKLSQRRAEAVKRYLISKFGLREEDLVAVGFGKTKLKNPNDPFGAENRRVQIANMANH
ncbi:MAG TPA: OmpA family protein [Xanthobacteraceae bacterium]|nr:OmpA family protein [Xanthobacteraceae bacterium]